MYVLVYGKRVKMLTLSQENKAQNAMRWAQNSFLKCLATFNYRKDGEFFHSSLSPPWWPCSRICFSSFSLSPGISDQLTIFFNVIHFPPPATIPGLTSFPQHKCEDLLMLKISTSSFSIFSHQAFKFTMRSFIKAIDDQILLKLKAVVYSTCDSPLNTIWHNCSLSFESLHLLGFSIP